MQTILETSISKYVILEQIGQGGTCTVFKGFCLSDSSKKLYAIKVFNENAKKYFDKEIRIKNLLPQENFLHIYNYGDGYIHKEEKKEDNENEDIDSANTIYSFDKYDEKVFYIIEELAENGELFNYVYKLKEGFSERISAKIFLKILKNLKILHDNRIAHCDIKPENVIIGNDFSIKLIDFGFSEILDKENNFIYDYKGSEIYSAPEIRNRSMNGYDGIKSDIFSMGVLFFVITVGRFPFEMCSYSDRYYRFIMNKKYEDFWRCFKKYNLSKEFRNLMEHLLCYDPSERFTIEEILKHPWMKINDAYEDYENKNNNYNNDIEIIEELRTRKEIIDIKES